MKYEEKLINTVEEDCQIPPIVEEHWQKAVDKITSGQIKQISGSHKPISVALKSVGALAAAFAILFTLSAVNPVFAENVPFMKDLLKYFNAERTPVNHGEAVTHTGAAENAKPVTKVERESGLSISQAYCDGTMLVFSTKLSLKEELPQGYSMVIPKYEGNINGQDVTIYSEYFERMYMTEPGVYVGSVAMDVKNLELKEDFELSVNVPSITAMDPNTMVMDFGEGDKGGKEEMLRLIEEDPINRYMISYTEKKEEFAMEDISFTGTIPVDPALTKVYEINKSQGECTVNKLYASPVYTDIDVQMPEGYYCTIEDDMGNEVQKLKLTKGGSEYFKPLYKGTKSVNIVFHSVNGETGNEAATINAEVEDGFVDLKEERSREIRDLEEVTYISDLEPIDENYIARRKGSAVYNLGESFNLDSDSGMTSLVKGSQDIKIGNMQVFDSPQEAGIATEDLQSGENSLEGKEDMAFVCFDVEIKNKDASSIFKYEDSETDMYFMPVNFVSKYPEKFQEPGAGIVYFDKAPTGEKDYYKFTMEPNGEFTCKIGLFMDKDALKNGYYQIAFDGTTPEGPVAAYVEIPPYRN